MGLKSYIILTQCEFGKSNVTNRALKSLPLWRYSAVVDGWTRGNYLRYVIPSNRENHLMAFVEELRAKKVISDYKLFLTTGPYYPLPNLNFYVRGKEKFHFDWRELGINFDCFEKENLLEPTQYGNAQFDMYDLFILQCLETDARIKARDIVEEMAESLVEKQRGTLASLVSRRLSHRIIPQGLLRDYRVEVFPDQKHSILLVISHICFGSSSSFKRFVGGLKLLPYNTACLKVIGRNELFVHFALPSSEYSNMHEAMTRLGESGHLRNMFLLFGDFANAVWENMKLYDMFREALWGRFSLPDPVQSRWLRDETRKTWQRSPEAYRFKNCRAD